MILGGARALHLDTFTRERYWAGTSQGW